MKMFSAIFLVVFLSTGFCSGFPQAKQAGQNDEVVTRTKRNIYQFARMLLCGTNRWPSDYVGYGCWCGLGGKGTPIDQTDKCCQTHDLCYKKVHRSGHCSYMGAAYTTIYKRKGCSDCDRSKNNNCQQAVCECDSNAVKCFKKEKFNDANKGYSQNKCV